MLGLCLPLMLGLGPFRVLARILGVVSILEAVLLWGAPEANAISWIESAQSNTLSYKEALHDLHHHRCHFGLMLALAGGFLLLHNVGSGGYTIAGLLKKRT